MYWLLIKVYEDNVVFISRKWQKLKKHLFTRLDKHRDRFIDLGVYESMFG